MIEQGHVLLKIQPHLTQGMLAGYAFHRKHRLRTKTAVLEWIWAPGFGKLLIDLIYVKLRDLGYDKVIAKVSIDPTEDQSTVKRRLNFYIGQGFRVEGSITYRENFGPLLTMAKELF